MMYMIRDNRFYIAVKAVIFHKEKFLVIKRSNMARGDHYYWEFPGGRLEFGESVLDTLNRELREEVSISADIIRPLSIWNFMKNKNTEIVGITYLCKTDVDKVKLSFEHEKYAWITKEDLSKYNIHPSVLSDISTWDWENIVGEV
ncbi:NUDIX hydrolase [Anaerosalibacter massiliensis]|nr:NUDIX domain-containing protein [Anaerosalibacter massiliensis]